MSFTLEQLLEQTGIREIGGTGQTKVANATSDGPDFAKLAERCRQALEDSPAEKPDSQQQYWVEKVAQVAVLRRTIQELRAIEAGVPTTKLASAPTDNAAFIKTALERGHSPKEVATFLESKDA